jgi:opacity protein-like surface antigen
VQFTRAAVGICGASLLAFFSNPAIAADLGRPREVIENAPVQPQSAAHRNFYVRGDVGIGRHAFKSFSQQDLTNTFAQAGLPDDTAFLSRSIGDTVYLGAGIGMQVSNRFRFDLTGEYRATAQVKALDDVFGDLTAPDGTLQANTLYTGQLSGVVGLLNGYWDLANWHGFTPYIGAGVGFAHLRMSGFTISSQSTFTDATTGDQTVQLASGFSDSSSKTNFAWALMAGTSYDLSSNAKLDLGYRYLNMGSGTSASTSLLFCTCGTIGDPLKISDITAHEIRLGVRWALGNPEPARVAYQPLK